MYIANATLSYTEKTTTQSGTDPVTGEIIFEENATTSSFLVSLEQKTTQSRTAELPGKDITGTYLEGRAMETSSFPRATVPSWYKADMMVDIIWDDGKCGKFYVMPTMSSRLNTDACFGHKIKGILLTNQ